MGSKKLRANKNLNERISEIRDINSTVRKRKVTVADVKCGYTPDKARIDLIAHLWLYLILRPISFYITPLFINLGLSANAVTALGLVPLLCGMVFILLGAVSGFNFIIGAILINIWYLCDGIDGNIARFQGRISKFGALLDFSIGLVYHTLLPLCLGLGLYLANPERSMLVLGLELPRWYLLAAGTVQVFASLFYKVVSLQCKCFVGEQDRKQENSRITVWTVLPKAIISFKPPLLLVASLVGALELFLFSYTAYYLAILVAVVALSLRKAVLADRRNSNRGENL